MAEKPIMKYLPLKLSSDTNLGVRFENSTLYQIVICIFQGWPLRNYIGIEWGQIGSDSGRLPLAIFGFTEHNIFFKPQLTLSGSLSHE